MNELRYILCIIERANVTFILQIIYSYLEPYQQNTLNQNDEKLIVLFYSLATLLATAIGGLLGGIITKKLGGYESKKSIFVIIIPEIITCINIFF